MRAGSCETICSFTFGSCRIDRSLEYSARLPTCVDICPSTSHRTSDVTPSSSLRAYTCMSTHTEERLELSRECRA